MREVFGGNDWYVPGRGLCAEVIGEVLVCNMRSCSSLLRSAIDRTHEPIRFLAMITPFWELLKMENEYKGNLPFCEIGHSR